MPNRILAAALAALLCSCTGAGARDDDPPGSDAGAGGDTCRVSCASTLDCGVGDACERGCCVRKAPPDAGGKPETDGGSDPVDAGGDPNSSGNPVGSACAADEECAGGTCLGLPGGYCTKKDCGSGCPEGSECFELTGGESACFRTCAASSECREDEGYVCDGDDTCYPGDDEPAPTGAPLGGECARDTDCATEECWPPLTSAGAGTGFVGGYCTVFGCPGNACPAGSRCIQVTTSTNACLEECAADSDCRAGYRCATSGTNKVCYPGCTSSASCPAGTACESGLCKPTPQCSAANPTGTCPSGERCESGTCRAFTCNTAALEPNETRAAALTAPSGTTANLGLCTGDHDWYALEVPAGKIATVGFTSTLSHGDLDLTVHDAQGCRGGRLMERCTWSRTYETGEEFVSVMTPAGAANRSWWWNIEGYRGAVNGYSLVSKLVTYTDGATCGAPYNDCDGRVNGARELIQFPLSDANDPYVPDGYRFDTMANYRWARRELVMLVRHAIHQVQQRYPNTKPLGLIDICQRDGITPGYDVGDPRHPQSTHDQGGNIDIAYYTTLASAGSLPYNEARIICGPTENNHNGSYCTTAARTGHVVDLPRQTYFMAQLFAHPRLRVIGVDKEIAPLLQAEAARQHTAGQITLAQKNAFTNAMAYGDGWPFHHHHIHLSLDWWGSALENAADDSPRCGFDLEKHRARMR